MAVPKAPYQERLVDPNTHQATSPWERWFALIARNATDAPALDVNDVLGTANQITVTDNDDGTITISIPDGAVIEFNKSGVRIQDTTGDHYLSLLNAEEMTDNQILSIVMGDTDRTLDMSNFEELTDGSETTLHSHATDYAHKHTVSSSAPLSPTDTDVWIDIT